jgi:hypothetical protein
MITNPPGLLNADPSAFMASRSAAIAATQAADFKTCPPIFCLICEYGCSCPLSWWC